MHTLITNTYNLPRSFTKPSTSPSCVLEPIRQFSLKQAIDRHIHHASIHPSRIIEFLEAQTTTR